MARIDYVNPEKIDQRTREILAKTNASSACSLVGSPVL